MLKSWSVSGSKLSDWTPVYENWKRFGDGKGWLNMGMNILLPDEERDTHRSAAELGTPFLAQAADLD